MVKIRSPFQGVTNIVRFNWHFYLISIFAIIFLLIFKTYANSWLLFLIVLSLIAIVTTTTISLLVSYYVYDFSDLYKLKWIDRLNINLKGTLKLVNIHAGFDETSCLLEEKFKDSDLKVYDFYDSAKHTEVSIKRARKFYPAFRNTEVIATNHLPLENNSIDIIFAILSAHEIREEAERIAFFNEIYRILKPSGSVIVVEHLRDLNNFLAYNIGFLHFHSKPTWLETFKSSKFILENEFKLTPFISIFLLNKNGTSS